MSALLLRGWPLALVLVAALWLRTHDLARRPMHADEANQAVKTGLLLESGDYVFDPRDHHGPTLYYAALPLAWLRGERTLAELSETTVRLLPALAGTAVVLFVALLAWPWGRWPAIAAAAFTALSPPAVYYSRYFVHETLLAAFCLATFLCARQWWRSARPGWAVAAGLCAGLALATKASAPFFLLAAFVAAAWSARTAAPAKNTPPRRAWLAGALAFVFSAIAIVALFYTSVGRHPGGLVDALDTYRLTADRLVSGETGHEKPWWYYASLFGRQRAGGLVFEQLTFAALALAGAVLASRGGDALARAALAFTLAVAVFLSLPAYKTPWHAIHLVPGLAFLATHALAAIRSRAIACVAAGLALAAQARQVERTAFARAADPRNPYAYVHSSPDVLKFRPLAEDALAGSPDQPIRVIGEEYWPLPWYLRGLPRVGYWSVPPDDCDGALIIVTAAQAPAVRARLRDDYRETLLGLRPGVLCVVFTPYP